MLLFRLYSSLSSPSFLKMRGLRVLATRSTVLLNSLRVESAAPGETTHLWLSYHAASSSGILRGNHLQLQTNNTENEVQFCMWQVMQRKLFSAGAGASENAPTDEVKELHDKMLKSVVEQKTAPPNAWLWSLIAKCATREDIKLLFEVLQRLRIFRLSNLRIHDNFNCALCQEVTRTCLRVGAIDYGKKTIWKHNLYGLSPNMGSAHQLLLYAEQQNDAKLMAGIMQLLNKNNLPMQPGTADCIFRICNKTGRWDLLIKYAKRFIKAEVNLRQTSFDMWMELAANRGDVESLWKAEKLRSKSKKKHTLVSGFACAKGLLLEEKPEDAAGIIQLLAKALSDEKKQDIMNQLQKLVSEWPLEVIKHQEEEKRKALVEALQDDIRVMVANLAGVGLQVNVNLEDLTTKAGVLS